MESLWSDVAVVSSIFAFGSIFFGHFEEQTSRWRKVLTLLLLIAVVVGLWMEGRAERQVLRAARLDEGEAGSLQVGRRY